MFAWVSHSGCLWLTRTMYVACSCRVQYRTESLVVAGYEAVAQSWKRNHDWLKRHWICLGLANYSLAVGNVDVDSDWIDCGLEQETRMRGSGRYEVLTKSSNESTSSFKSPLRTYDPRIGFASELCVPGKTALRCGLVKTHLHSRVPSAK
jgi:hypothetical protein